VGGAAVNLGLSGKVALISGASRGIGFAIAAALAAEGARVVIVARDPSVLNAAAERLTAANGKDRVLAIAADMCDDGSVAQVVDRVETEFGPIDAAVANAGSGSGAAGVVLSRTDWQNGFEANLLPAVLLASAVLPRMTERGQGNLTIVSSIAGIDAIRAPIPYSATKAALDMAVKRYAQEVGPRGVRVNAVAPGNVFFPGGSWAVKFEDETRRSAFAEYIHNEVPLRRFATAREIADVVTFLASTRASFVSGAIVVVDGGQTRSL
jgi:3-oxoacyl-[acyl-carrier protein] reductase